MRRALIVAGMLMLAAAPAVAQQVTVRDAGPGAPGRVVRAALAAPHRLYGPGTGDVHLERDSSYATTIIVVGRDATVASHVNGDVIVVGGNLFVRPGAQVEGRAIAIGGGAYGSMLGIVRGGLQEYRDETFLVQPLGSNSYALDYRRIREGESPPFTLPGLYGLGIPAYDRVDGLSLRFAPLLSLRNHTVQVEPRITWRTNLGAIDPELAVDAQPTRRDRLKLRVGRTTLTNDGWIYSTLLNSASTLGLGLDTRNYWRADRAEFTAHHLLETATLTLEPYVGVRVERGTSVGPDSSATGGPWSLFGRKNRQERILRPNPAIDRGQLASLLFGVAHEWNAQGLRATGVLDGEVIGQSPNSRRATQFTYDGAIGFPTFGMQRLDVDLHGVLTLGDTAPRQRWAYLGGSGTLPLLELLSLGGDQLLFVNSRYLVPIPNVDLKFVGQPSISFLHAIGGASVHKAPRLEQMVGLRVALSFVRLQYVRDPRTSRGEFSAGLSLTR
ncbi:MAG: hypothetical protein JWO05_486 [Gemmatimonadetes bacterium]|nr:hypothetical protein [Gemmatimonadota bacterium]